MEHPFSKQKLRSEALKIRSEISSERRLAAEMAASLHVPESGLVLSYSAINFELSLNQLNRTLASQQRLVLPKVLGESLRFYLVENLEAQLTPSNLGILEPNQDLCTEIFPLAVSTLLIPGLYFDTFKNRLGYGKGHFDRILPLFAKESKLIGIGFKEQLYSGRLPFEVHDIPLSDIALF